jgi:hypothetical protein
MKIPRKLLVVRQTPPRRGWVVMLEQDGQRTKVAHLPDAQGEALMSDLQDVVAEHLLRHIGSPSPRYRAHRC